MVMKFKYWLVIILLFVGGIGSGYALEIRWPLQSHLKKILPRIRSPKCSFTRHVYPKLKRDKYALHRLAAQNLPDAQYILNDQTQNSLQEQNILQKMSDSTGYRVLHMNYGTPYLHHRAMEELKVIEREFLKTLEEKGLPKHQFVISSASRTDENQRALSKVNPNGTMGKSAHSYGAAIDIPYVSGPQCYEAGSILADLLLKRRREGHIYITPESRTIHVTVRSTPS